MISLDSFVLPIPPFVFDGKWILLFIVVLRKTFFWNFFFLFVIFNWNVARYFCFLLSMICFQNGFVFTFRSWWLVRKGYDQNRKQIQTKIINGNCNHMPYHIIYWHIFNRVILNNIFDEIISIRDSILLLKKLFLFDPPLLLIFIMHNNNPFKIHDFALKISIEHF